MDLIYWREIGRTGVVFTGLVLGLLCLFQLSAITVISTVSLSIMCFTLPVRLLYKALELLRWSRGAHPFQSYIEPDASLTDEQTILYVQRIVVTAASAITEIKRLFFVADLIDSIKFVVLMYLLTYVGILCNGLTLLIIGVICIFSLPLFYKRHQERIERVVTAVTSPVKKITNLICHVVQRVKATPPVPAPTSAPGPKAKAKTK
ncbi:hypothetical protein SKAU_G00270860 [Synaphobranchus kaupii]|uniref:Reticulon n=1 Tax=Synaphobranchus kaupii TaxID=118154 RepID=A0A9Q1IQD0_SYNKA|nr:hypothetical protein SKAU_G00270860 [Synaphobranchus kaupii]